MKSKKKPESDMISKLKKESQKKKVTQEHNKESSEEENEEEVKKVEAIKEQAEIKPDKPKGLRDLFNDDDDEKPKQVIKAQKPAKKKDENKLKFTNTKGGNSLAKFDEEKRKNMDKKTFKNSKAFDDIQKENEKIKPTKNYNDKEVKKAYQEDKEDVKKPEFKNLGKNDENFVALNKDEDLFAKNMATGKFEHKMDYSNNNNEERKKKKHYEKKKVEKFENDVDSDGFEIVGSKEEKKAKFNEKKPKYFKKSWPKKEKRDDKNEEDKEEKGENTKEDDKKEAPKEEKKVIKVNFERDQNAKCLKDLF